MKNLCTTCSWQPIQHIPVTRSMRFPAWIYPGRQSVDRRVARWSWERFLLGQIRVRHKTIRIWWRIHLGASDSNGVLSSRYLYDMWVCKSALLQPQPLHIVLTNQLVNFSLSTWNFDLVGHFKISIGRLLESGQKDGGCGDAVVRFSHHDVLFWA